LASRSSAPGASGGEELIGSAPGARFVSLVLSRSLALLLLHLLWLSLPSFLLLVRKKTKKNEGGRCPPPPAVC